MNRYNPYIVPEGFFDDVCRDALKNRAKHRRMVRMALGAAAAAAVLLATPFILDGDSREDMEITASCQDRLAENYANDMFLLVSFE